MTDGRLTLLVLVLLIKMGGGVVGMLVLPYSYPENYQVTRTSPIYKIGDYLLDRDLNDISLLHRECLIASIAMLQNGYGFHTAEKKFGVSHSTLWWYYKHRMLEDSTEMFQDMLKMISKHKERSNLKL